MGRCRGTAVIATTILTTILCTVSCFCVVVAAISATTAVIISCGIIIIIIQYACTIVLSPIQSLVAIPSPRTCITTACTTLQLIINLQVKPHLNQAIIPTHKIYQVRIHHDTPLPFLHIIRYQLLTLPKHRPPVLHELVHSLNLRHYKLVNLLLS